MRQLVCINERLAHWLMSTPNTCRKPTATTPHSKHNYRCTNERDGNKMAAGAGPPSAPSEAPADKAQIASAMRALGCCAILSTAPGTRGCVLQTSCGIKKLLGFADEQPVDQRHLSRSLLAIGNDQATLDRVQEAVDNETELNAVIMLCVPGPLVRIPRSDLRSKERPS